MFFLGNFLEACETEIKENSAIQGLKRKIEERKEQIKTIETEISNLQEEIKDVENGIVIPLP